MFEDQLQQNINCLLSSSLFSPCQHIYQECICDGISVDTDDVNTLLHILLYCKPKRMLAKERLKEKIIEWNKE